MRVLKLLTAMLTMSFFSQAQPQSPPLPLPPKHKFDEGPITPAPCAAPASPRQENELAANDAASIFSLAKAIVAPLQKWAARYNTPMNGDDAGYEVAVDDSGFVYVAGASLNKDSNYDAVAIKYNKDGKQQWLARYNSLANHNDVAYALAVDDSGNIYIGGYTLNADFNNDFVTVKYNRNGVRQWVARYNGPGNWHDGIFDLQLDQQGNVYVAGYSYAPNSGYDWAVIKYNSAGVEQWLARYNGPGNAEDCPYEMTLDQNANLYLTGYCTGKGNNFDFLTAKYNSAGVRQWAYRYNGPSNKNDISNDIVLDHAGNVCVTGKSHNPDGNADYLTLKFSNSGVRQWIARYNRPNKSYARALDIAVDSENSIFVTGRTIGNHTGDDWVTLKYTPTGIRHGTAHHTSRGFRSEVPCRILIDADDQIYVAGYSYIAGWPCRDYLLISYSRSLSTLSLMVYEGPSHLSDIPYDMVMDKDNNIYITGASQSAKTDADIATVKYDLWPFKKASVAEKNDSAATRNSALPTTFALAQNFPNPFNPNTTISFALPIMSHVQLSIYNLNGKLVHTLVNGAMNAGYHHLQYDASRLASGVYFYRLDTGLYSATRKMILQK